ncbi:glycosyltransferase [Halorubrum ezzemoulense]|uniref:Group 1 glycosyl transferase n=1 Tax=Halorubrum ezzemoulense TaxID=337243 RepID=A0A256JSN9_HALEZ|nr:glycosyltransferase [Halorubrum ezzemoulense]OYR71801.1 group 1 glycosyl transferase [Halorubrum ezzemoulense]
MDASAADEPVDFDNLDVAVAHWHVNAWGGAEYLVTKLAEAVDADRIYTLGEPDPDDPNPYGPMTFEDVTPTLDYSAVRRLQRRAGRLFEYSQWEDVDWREFGDPDVLVTSGATTRAVITPDDTLHVNYCHSPPRWFYDLYHDRKGSPFGVLSRPMIRYLRTRDMAVDPRVDHYFVNSPIIERRLWKYYKRESEVVYPPVDLGSCRTGKDEGYYLHLGRLDEEKGVPAVISAFEGTDHRLVLAGGKGDIDKSVRHRIDQADNLDYRGFVPEESKYDLLAGCRALVFNGRNEDFGIVPIEANACQKAVLTRNEGFPSVFIEDGENGYLHDGTSSGIADAIQRFEHEGVNGDLVAATESFGIERFKSELLDKILSAYVSFSTYGTI